MPGRPTADPRAGTNDPYEILGVERSASPREIRAAYRTLVERYHPDRHHGNPLEALASERMAEINQAYDVLSDPARRAVLDRGSGHDRVQAGRAQTGAAHATSGSGDRRPPPRPGMNPLTKWGLGLLLLPLLIRTGGGLLRAVAGLLRALFGELGAFRGTPAVLILALLAALLLGRSLWRRWRRSRPSDG